VKHLLAAAVVVAVFALAVWLFLDRGERKQLRMPVEVSIEAPSSAPVPSVEPRRRITPGDAVKEPATESKPAEDPGTAVLGFIGGRVTFGDAPDPLPQPIDMGSKASECGTKDQPIAAEYYVAGPDGGAANVIVYVKSGPATKIKTPLPASEAFVEISRCRYTPHVMAMRAGQPFRFWNRDAIQHNLHLSSKVNGDWNQTLEGGGALLAGERSSAPFANGEVPVSIRDDIFPWMRAFVGVFDHDSFAVTTTDGLYELKRLPPGDYVIGAWHERAKVLNERVTLLQGQMRTLDFELKFK
jgi:hypothetical protein